MQDASSEVTFVITSCGRPELLARTLDSFLKNNDAPIARYVLVEDSARPDVHGYIRERYGHVFDHLLFNEQNIGQISSIDRAYALVDTPYLFHCEDDFEFLRPGFIQESLSVLRHEPEAISVWLRHLWDCNKHKFSERIQYTPDGAMYRHVLPKIKRNASWYGFTFNPGLRRTADYRRVAPFSEIGHELEINYRYHELGYHGVVLEEGAAQHVGAGHHVGDSREPWTRRLRLAIRGRRHRRRERKRGDS